MWHYSRIFSDYSSREAICISWGSTTEKRVFCWFDCEVGLKKSNFNISESIFRFHSSRPCDYVGRILFRTTKELILVDFLGKGMKESCFEAILGQDYSICDTLDQEKVVYILRDYGYDGWMSWHDKKDESIEFCIFSPTASLLEIEREILGP